MITIFQQTNYITVLGVERHKHDVIYNFPKKMSVYVEDSDSFVIKTTFTKEVVIIPFEDIINGNVIDNSITPVPYTIASLRTFLQNCTAFNSAGSGSGSVSLNLNGNTLEILDDEGNVISFQDLSPFLDDTNLSRVISISVDANGLATFTRDDASTFTGDLSVLLDDTNLGRIESGSIVGNNIELVRGDGTVVLIDISNFIALEDQVTQNVSDLNDLQVEQLGQQIEININTSNIADLQSEISREFFETVSKNLKSFSNTFNYAGELLTSIVYDLGDGQSITKTFNYTLDLLTSIVLSGSTPFGIDLTKTFIYNTGQQLTNINYS